MQWVGTPPLAAAVAAAGALGMLTALTQPSPDALREAIRDTRKRMGTSQGKFVSFQLALLSLGRQHHPFTFHQPARLVSTHRTPLSSAGYVKAAMDEGIEIFETAGNNRKSAPDETKQ
jgi:NAD(P)H-dependent flavin oxidoreductase YrpB (nitropropane dioxygenase family)